MLDGDREFDLAVEQLGDALVPFDITDDQAQARRTGLEAGQGRGDEEADGGGEGGYPDFAGGAFGVQAHGFFGAFYFGEDGVGVVEQEAAGRGDGDSAAAAFQEFLADLGFEGRELLGDGRRGQVQDLGGRRHGAVVSKRSQDPQSAYFDHEAQLPTAPSGGGASGGGGAFPVRRGRRPCRSGILWRPGRWRGRG